MGRMRVTHRRYNKCTQKHIQQIWSEERPLEGLRQRWRMILKSVFEKKCMAIKGKKSLGQPDSRHIFEEFSLLVMMDSMFVTRYTFRLGLRLIHTYNAVSMPRPCRVAKGVDCVFTIWFTQCSRVWFTHPMPFWKRLLKATAQRGMGATWVRHGHGMSAAWAWHGMAWHSMAL
jgi:hypothetical protein